MPYCKPVQNSESPFVVEAIPTRCLRVALSPELSHLQLPPCTTPCSVLAAKTATPTPSDTLPNVVTHEQAHLGTHPIFPLVDGRCKEAESPIQAVIDITFSFSRNLLHHDVHKDNPPSAHAQSTSDITSATRQAIVVYGLDHVRNRNLDGGAVVVGRDLEIVRTLWASDMVKGRNSLFTIITSAIMGAIAMFVFLAFS
ncbi:hypothetical protein F5878DRAFT_658956 [Lentinula raphanica]|uniref:Uncharacterized protein n=1 Tax=Lentinula raphanica TaxID=153919 RepID=A0AA38PDW9_9AGAR|nr:hypothetical protein F5878DRAFT_658956 [Lentinula raphanica]